MGTTHHGGWVLEAPDCGDATSKGPPVPRMSRVLSAALIAAVLLPAAPAAAHVPLPPNNYACLSADESQYMNRHLHVRAGKEYAFKYGNGDRIGSAGEFAHSSDTNRIRFTSGYLANQGWRGTHSVVTEGSFRSYKVTLRKYVDGQVVKVYKCSPQSG